MASVGHAEKFGTSEKDELQLPIATIADVERVRREAWGRACALGLSTIEAASVAVAVSELATNLVRYATGGEIRIRPVPASGDRGVGIEVVSTDRGPGIRALEDALTDGLSTGGGLGSGLPSVRRLMDTFSIESHLTGTRIVACKYRQPR